MKATNIIYSERTIGNGITAYKVLNADTMQVLAEYHIVDHSTEQGTMYLVHKAEDTSKAIWVDNIAQAWAVCKQDYMARVK